MIDTCIFDFGNVLIRFDPMYMTRAYIASEPDAALCAPVIFDRLYWDRLDDGSISDEEVKRLVCARLPQRLHASACAVYDHWAEQLPEIEGMRGLVEQLKREGKRLYLLSNISQGFEQQYPLIPAIASLLALFDGCVFSGSLHMVKPSPEIFRHLLSRFALRAEQCVFIDDSERNIAGARAVGITGVLFCGDARQTAQELSRLMQ